MKHWDVLSLTDGRAVTISVDPDTDAVSLGTDAPGGPLLTTTPTDMGLIAAGLERAAVLAGHQEAKRQTADRETPRLTIEQVASAIAAAAPEQPPEPADAGLHAATCAHRRNWACDCEAGR